MSLRTSIQRQRMTAKKGGILPVGYIECEYLESNAKQYIDTLIVPNDTFQFAITFKLVSNLYCFLFGNGPETTGLFPVGRDYEIGLYYGNIVYNRPQIIPNEVNTIEVKDHIAYTNGVEGEHLTQPFTSSRYTIYLFAQRNYNAAQRHCTAQIYSFSCGNGADEIVLIPALDPNGRPCMFDTISQTPFYNLGTGEFGYMTKSGVYVAPI